MIKNWKFILFICLLLSNFILYKGCKKYKNELNIVKLNLSELKKTYDSISSLPPDTIEINTVIKKDSLIYVDNFPSIPAPPTAKAYIDSLINDTIDVRVSILADNIYSIKYAYKPIYKYQNITIEKKVPYPVTEIKEIEVKRAGFYGGVGLGFSGNMAYKLGLLYLMKNDHSIGIDFVRVGNNNIFLANYGIKL